MPFREVDFICVGGGLGGLAAAIRAHDLGLEVLILEKSDKLGGVAAYSAGHTWVPNNHLMLSSAAGDSTHAAALYMDHVSGSAQVDAELRDAFLEQAPRAIKYYHDAGIEFRLVEDYPDFLYPQAPGSSPGGRNLEAVVSGPELGDWRQALQPNPHFEPGLTRSEIIRFRTTGDSREIDRLRRRRVDEDFLTLGQGLAGAFVKVAVCDRGVAVHTRSPALRLLQTDGRVIGAVADVGGQPTEIRARRGVLIATGAYGNAPYAAAWEGLPELHDAGPPVTDGDHLSLTEPTPAAQVRAGEAFVTLGFHLPGEVHADTNTQLYRQAITSLGFPHSMIVNAAGRRFGDESLHGRPPGLLDRDARTRHFTNYPCWLIVDDRFRRRYGLGPLPAGAAWPSGWASAGSIGQLASQAGIDKRGLAEAVSRLNRFAEAGVDEDFRRGSLLHVQRAYGDPAYANPNLGTVEDSALLGYSAGPHWSGYLLHRPKDRSALPRARRGPVARTGFVRDRQCGGLHGTAALHRGLRQCSQHRVRPRCGNPCSFRRA